MKNLFYIIAFLFVFSSCELDPKRITIETTDFPPTLSVYGCIVDTLGYQEIWLKSTSPYFSGQPNEAISNALVQITVDNSTYVLVESNTTKGLYHFAEPIKGIPGTTYHLKVTVDFNKDGISEIYTAQSTMLSGFNLDAIQIDNYIHSDLTSYYLYIYAQDSPSEDYYLCRYKVNGTYTSPKLSKYSLLDDRSINGQYISGLWLYAFYDENDRDEYSDDIKENITFVSPGDKITMEMSKIEKGYYNFIKQSKAEIDGENAPGSPQTNIITNISNGGVGYFVAYSISSAKAIIEIR